MGASEGSLFLFFDAALTVCGIEQPGWYVGPQPSLGRSSNLLESCSLGLGIYSSAFGAPLDTTAADWVGCATYAHTQASGLTVAIASPPPSPPPPSPPPPSPPPPSPPPPS